MQVVILAGGFGTRLSEETVYKPKPMVEIGNKPILETIIENLAKYGFDKITISDMGLRHGLMFDRFCG
jgi:glucose-1-phosphate cytidylyltransferase